LNNRKYKKQETSFKNEISKMKKDYEDTRKRLTELDNENKKIVGIFYLFFNIVSNYLYYLKKLYSRKT
jgi:hypothetical protein